MLAFLRYFLSSHRTFHLEQRFVAGTHSRGSRTLLLHTTKPTQPRGALVPVQLFFTNRLCLVLFHGEKHDDHVSRTHFPLELEHTIDRTFLLRSLPYETPKEEKQCYPQAISVHPVRRGAATKMTCFRREKKGWVKKGMENVCPDSGLCTPLPLLRWLARCVSADTTESPVHPTFRCSIGELDRYRLLCA